MLALVSIRLTDQPQKWAAAPALFMGLGGLLLLGLGSPAQEVLVWVWPPALLVLVAWMILHTNRQLHSSGGRILLYPVFVLLTLASVGSSFETVCM